MHASPSLRRFLLSLAVTWALLLPAAPGRADPLLNITLADSPTVQSIPGTPIGFTSGGITYNATTGEFRSDTIPVVVNANTLPMGFGLFDLSLPGAATIDLFVNKNGSFVSSGLGYRLTGSVDLDGDGTNDVTGTNANPLLFGPVVAFGGDQFESNPPGIPTITFDGMFVIQGGLLTQPVMLSGGGSVSVGFMVGQRGGFFLDAENQSSPTPPPFVLGNFMTNFASDTVKDLEGVAIPAPPSAVLAVLGAGLLALSRRGRRLPPG